MTGVLITEIWFDQNLDEAEFVAALERKFPGAEAKKITTVEDAKPGYWLYHLSIPSDGMEELIPFLEQYAATHGAEHEKMQASLYPFNPLA